MRILAPLLAAALLAAPALAKEGMIHQTATTDVAETVAAFEKVLKSKGATVFAIVEHANGAASVDMELAPATLVIFGNPKLGTPMMQAAPSMGAELPMKAHFTGGEDGGTIVTYTDIKAVAERHGVPTDHEAVQKAAKALDGLTGAIAK